jgi:hypothetical protein
MVIEIKSDIFSGNDFKGLNYFIQIATHKNRYTIFADLSKVTESPFYKRLDFEDKEILESNFNSQILQQSKSLGKSKAINNANFFITNFSSSLTELNLEEAVRFFIQPISIILENSLNDQFFTVKIINCFDSKGEIKRHLENDWIQFENAGGCTNVENFINGKLESFNLLPKDNNRYLRCFVLLDGDREHMNLPVNQKHTNLEAFLKRNFVIHHILEKRSMENYMPDEAYNEFRNGTIDNWIDAYLHLNDNQKDFLNISKGFPKKQKDGTAITKREELDGEIQKLYSSVSKANFDILNEGFKLSAFKSNFPLKFKDSHSVHRKSLKARISHQTKPNELEEILEKISQLL